MKPRPALLIAAMAIALVLTLPGCKRGSRPAGPPPVILIVMDTVRADHLGVYGYPRDTTPNVDAFAKTAVRYQSAHAPASWTVPSMASFFTGVYPWSHGVVKAEVGANSEVGYQLTLNDKFTTLAESLQNAGYITYGVTANYHMHERYGMAQGFVHYKAFAFRDREPVDLQLKDWLPQIQRTYDSGQPYFLFVHYFDPHHPYMPVEPFIAKWRPTYDEERIRNLVGAGFVDLASEEHFFEHPEDMQVLVDLYDSEVAAVDDSVGKLLAQLPGADRAMIVVTADHGEAFGDHHNMIHGRDLWAEAVRVPLLIRYPNGVGAGTVVDQPVSLVDVYPTAAALAGSARPKYLAGVDLATDLPKVADRHLYSQTQRIAGMQWNAIIGPTYKWVFHVDDQQHLLYNVATDLTDAHDLYAEHPDDALALYRQWVKAYRRHPIFRPGNAGNIDPDLRQQLKDLGYL